MAAVVGQRDHEYTRCSVSVAVEASRRRPRPAVRSYVIYVVQISGETVARVRQPPPPYRDAYRDQSGACASARQAHLNTEIKLRSQVHAFWGYNLADLRFLGGCFGRRILDATIYL